MDQGHNTSATPTQPPEASSSTKTRRKVRPRLALPGTAKFSALDPPSGASPLLLPSNADASHSTPSNPYSFHFRPPITPGPSVTSNPSGSRSDTSESAHLTPYFAPSLPEHDPSPENIQTDTLFPFAHADLDEFSSGPISSRPLDSRSSSDKIHDFLRQLRDDKISPVEVLIQALDVEGSENSRYREKLYRDDDVRLTRLLETIMADDKGKRKLLECMRPQLLDFACNMVAEQMDQRRKASILPGINSVTPEFIEAWNLDEEEDLTPFLTRILETAAQTKYAEAHNKIKRPQKMCQVVTRQLLYQYSNRCLGFQAEFGLFLWSTGCARQTIDALFRCGLSVSYDSVLNLIQSLSYHCDSRAIAFSKDLHGFCYDNMNLSTSIFVEQRGPSGPAKVQSGTFGLLYRIRNVAEHMLIAPIIKRFKATTGLHFNCDIRPTLEQLSSCHDQFIVIAIDRLIDNEPGFEYVAKHPLIQHKTLRAIPVGYVSDFCPLRASTTEEATVRGNLLFHDEMYLQYLGRTPEELSKYAIPGFHDQLTNARIRAAQILRAKDVDAWSRREVFQLGFGLFHLCLNLVWAILHVHRGSINEPGTLAYFFAVMEKTQLGNDQPDYHTLLAALTQILDGLLLNAWQRECGSVSLAEFAKSRPSPEKLREISAKILDEYATPMASPNPPPPPSSDSSDNDSDASETDSDVERAGESTTAAQIDPKDDIAHRNIRLLARDLLVLIAVVRAISDGDIGRVEVFLPHLAMMFRGAGCNKYCTEILHFVLNLKHIWIPEFAHVDIMRDNIIVCLSGLGPGHCMAIDLNIEHLIGYLKTLLKAKGMNSTWDRLGNISAAIVQLQRVKKKVSSALDAGYKSSRHTTPDISQMVKRVQRKVHQEGLHKFQAGRANNDRRKLVCDIQMLGESRLKSSTLGTFNKKVLAMVDGIEVEEEEDECPAISFATATPPDD
ncbi:hypothetical protein FB451DRAFT_1051517 [Mycena latifolia]|nr:hypothetical protein FB451DRAFT_1051517 [Mycena latifolia]